MKSLTRQEMPVSEETEQTSVPVFAYELLRDILIPELLGKDSHEVSYWAGKHLARKFPLLSLDEATAFFEEAGWGHLYIVHEKKNEYKLELSGNLVERRLQVNASPCFRLETGFLAQQVQSMKQSVAEAFDEVNKKERIVTIIIRWDKKDLITN